MTPEVRNEIETLITERLLLFYEALIERGQISAPLAAQYPSVSRPLSHCSQSARMPEGS